jgi:hypothetical protein
MAVKSFDTGPWWSKLYSNLYVNVVHFFNTNVNLTSKTAQDKCFPAQVSNLCCSIDSMLGLNVIKLFTSVIYE